MRNLMNIGDQKLIWIERTVDGDGLSGTVSSPAKIPEFGFASWGDGKVEPVFDPKVQAVGNAVLREMFGKNKPKFFRRIHA